MHRHGLGKDHFFGYAKLIMVIQFYTQAIVFKWIEKIGFNGAGCCWIGVDYFSGQLKPVVP